jgi:phenylacetate-CoA ligase
MSPEPPSQTGPAPGESYLDRAAETAPQPERSRRQEARLAEVLALAREKAPAYRELYAAAGEVRGLEDLGRLPVVRLSDLSRWQKESPPLGGVATRPPGEFRRLYVNPGLIAQPGGDGPGEPTWAEGLAAAGLGPGTLALNAFSHHLWPFAFQLDADLAGLGGATVPAGPENAFMQARIMARLGVNAFLGTPSHLLTLAQRARAAGLEPGGALRLEAAVVGAEMLSESLRQRLAERWRAPVRQLYGTVLTGCLGYECGRQSGLHAPQGVIVEVADPETGRPLPPGQVGEVVATCLNPAFPLIRLATGDLSRLVEAGCACGRTGPRLERILGRADQAVKVHGTFVHPWQIDEVAAAHPGVLAHQAVVTREGERDRLTLMVEVEGGAPAAGDLAGRLEAALKDHLYLAGRVQVQPPGTIPDFHGKIVDRRQWD